MNILPLKNKNIIKIGLRNRFIIIASILISISFLIGIVSLVPAYMLVKGYFSLEENESQLNVVIEDNNEILLVPVEIDSKLSVVQGYVQNVSFKNYTATIVSLLPDNIFLNSIKFAREGKYKDQQGAWFMISGFSQNRDSLLNFVNELKKSGNFSIVEVPVSDLTKETNLNFTMNLVYSN
jgi:hypothetical protein